MPKPRPKGAAQVVKTMERNPHRGQVYWFLRDEHDAILAKTQGRPIAWGPVLADIQMLGLKNANGQPVTNENTLRSTWARVRRDKRRETEAKQQAVVERRRPTTDPPPVVWSPGAYQAPMQVPDDRSVSRPSEPIDPIERLRLKTLRMSGKRV